jgi:hypothetical protein
MCSVYCVNHVIGIHPGIANPEGGKPKGMHWRTFERLKAEHNAFANASWISMAERLGLMNRGLVGLVLEPFDDLGRDGLICFVKVS